MFAIPNRFHGVKFCPKLSRSQILAQSIQIVSDNAISNWKPKLTLQWTHTIWAKIERSVYTKTYAFLSSSTGFGSNRVSHVTNAIWAKIYRTHEIFGRKQEKLIIYNAYLSCKFICFYFCNVNKNIFTYYFEFENEYGDKKLNYFDFFYNF